jgi:hypothetical protein
MTKHDEVKLLIDGSVVPVTHLFDEYGGKVFQWSEATRFVAGPLADGHWLADICADYDVRVIQ